jgi:hypothetical protein
MNQFELSVSFFRLLSLNSVPTQVIEMSAKFALTKEAIYPSANHRGAPLCLDT